MIKKKSLTTIILILFFFTKLFSFENKILVKVNNDIITSLDLKNKINTILFLANQPIDQKNINDTKIIALNSVINLKLKNQENIKYQIKVDEKEVLMHLSEISNSDINNLKANFSKNGLDFEYFKEEIQIELGWRKLIYFLYNNKIDFDEREINEEVKKIKLEKSQITEYNISEIKVSFKDDMEKTKKINEVQKLLNTESFEDVAFKFSESQTSSTGGNLGWINENALSKEVSQTLKKMIVGEVSLPIISLNSILFLKLTDKKNRIEKIKNIDEIKKDLINTKKNDLFKLYSNSHLSKLKNTAFIEEK